MGTFDLYLETARHIAKKRGRSLPEVLAKMAYARAVGFGPRFFVLYDLLDKPLSAYSSFIQNDDLDPIQARINKPDGRREADNKLAFFERCKAFNLPTPEVYGVIASGLPHASTNVPVITEVSQLARLFDASQGDRFILKPIEGSHGAGIQVIDRNHDTAHLAKVFKQAQATGLPTLVQAAIRPHPELRLIMPGDGLGTARFITTLENGRPSIRFACVRLPVGTALIDNFVDGTTGNLLADIDVVTGKLGRCIGPGTAPRGVEWVERRHYHPDTGALLEGFQFPQWADIRRTVERAALAFPNLTTVGWDVALGGDGPTLLEANWSYGVVTLQAACGQGLKDFFRQMDRTAAPKALDKARLTQSQNVTQPS